MADDPLFRKPVLPKAAPIPQAPQRERDELAQKLLIQMVRRLGPLGVPNRPGLEERFAPQAAPVELLEILASDAWTLADVFLSRKGKYVCGNERCRHPFDLSTHKHCPKCGRLPVKDSAL